MTFVKSQISQSPHFSVAMTMLPTDLCLKQMMKMLPYCTSFYIALPAYESALMKGILQLSQAHKFSNDGDIVYSGNGLLSFHSENGGLKKVSLSNGKTVEFN